ncbi:MAG: hypothetical protein RBR97_17735 [Bacteroidales bacterium]|jgi:hypothetical protein|nr:hypothetical protein [Bacteroidales bacterium]
MSEIKQTLLDKKRRWIEISKKLKVWEIKFIEMRAEGFGYNQIRDELTKEFKICKSAFKNNNQLRNLIYHKGRLNEAFSVYSEVIAMESFERGQQIIKQAHAKASMTIVKLLGGLVQDHVKLSAAKDILDRNAGKATQPLEIADSSEIEALRKQVEELSQTNANITRLSSRIKNTGPRISKGKKHS